MAMLIVFILLILGISNYVAQQIIYDGSIRQQEQLTKLYEREFIKINNEVQEHAHLIAEDPQIKKYIYAITLIGADKEVLKQLYEKKFKSTIKQDVIFYTENAGTLFTNKNLENHNNLQALSDNNDTGLVYISQKDHLQIVARTPILYGDEKIGSLVVYQTINRQWLNSLPRNPDSHIFIVNNQNIIATTYINSDKRFSPTEQYLNLDKERYRLTAIPIVKDIKNPPDLWLAESETRLFAPLRKFNEASFIIILSSCLMLLFTGILAIKRISNTINNLVIAANLMTQGKKPEIKRSESNTEIAILYNQFADMVDTIHERDEKVQAAHEQLKKISITDELTQLYNRRHLSDIYPKLIAQAERSDLSVCAILCDIDFFKKINDTYGHTAGDQCLIYFSNLLRSITRNSDYLFRMGGEEFLILSLTKSIEDAEQLGNKICKATEAHSIEWEDLLIPMTVSCGISCSKQNDIPIKQSPSLSLLVSSADHALYKAKHNGRNQICSSNELQ